MVAAAGDPHEQRQPGASLVVKLACSKSALAKLVQDAEGRGRGVPHHGHHLLHVQSKCRLPLCEAGLLVVAGDFPACHSCEDPATHRERTGPQVRPLSPSVPSPGPMLRATCACFLGVGHHWCTQGSCEVSALRPLLHANVLLWHKESRTHECTPVCEAHDSAGCRNKRPNVCQKDNDGHLHQTTRRTCRGITLLLRLLAQARQAPVYLRSSDCQRAMGHPCISAA